MSDSTLRFLADENCDFAIIRALRSQGFDVLAVSEYTQRSDDRVLIDLAFNEQRILLTEDKDFGWLVYVSRVESAGVILLRFPGNRRIGLVAAVLQLVQERGDEIRGRFVVMQPGRVRIGRRP